MATEDETVPRMRSISISGVFLKEWCLLKVDQLKIKLGTNLNLLVSLMGPLLEQTLRVEYPKPHVDNPASVIFRRNALPTKKEFSQTAISQTFLDLRKCARIGESTFVDRRATSVKGENRQTIVLFSDLSRHIAMRERNRRYPYGQRKWREANSFLREVP